MKVLITGASGFLGKKLMSILSTKYEVYGTYFSQGELCTKRHNYVQLDATSSKQVEKLFARMAPSVVIHSIGIPNPDRCEANRDKTCVINVSTTQNVVNACHDFGSKLIYVSTNYVFDGKSSPYKEEDAPHPVNFYGLTKLQGEELVQKLDDHVVARMPILYGYNDDNDKPTFVTKILEKLRRNQEVYVDAYRIRYPTLIDDVGLAFLRLIEEDAQGIYHLANNEGATKYEMALKTTKIFEFTSSLIKTFKEDGRATRPNDVRLDTSKIKRLGVRFVDVEEGLRIMRNQMLHTGRSE